MLIFVKTCVIMKKILLTLSIAAALLAGVSCKKDNTTAPPEYAAILGLWELCSADGVATYDIISISETDYVEKNIFKSFLELDELVYEDSDCTKVESISKVQSDLVDSDVWEIALDGWHSRFIYDVSGETAKLVYWPLEQEPTVYLLRAIKKDIKLTWHYVPKSAYDLGLSVYWGAFDMQTSYPSGFDPDKDYFENWISSGSSSFYSPGKLYTFPENDPVNETFGGKWRMPTKEEWEELFDNCSWMQETNEDVSFPLMIARSTKPGYETEYLVLPMNGYIYNSTRQYNGQGYFWSSDPDSDSKHFCARIENEQRLIVSMNNTAEVAIRPVWDPNMNPNME